MENKIYFWNQKNQNFELSSIPEWVGYEPMIDVATDALALIKENKDYQVVHNIYLALGEIDSRYGYSDVEDIYHKNIGEIRHILANILNTRSMLESADSKKEKNDIQRVIDNFFIKAEMLLRSLANGVVTLDGTKTQGSPFFHITYPSQDIYTYNGRDFYMWDGWHSSKKVMEGMADKCFNG